jgi:large subunit ribosomal protein L29
MELKELRAASINELKKLVAQQREKLRATRFSVSAKQLKNIKSVREIKKLIARILTITKEKEREEVNQSKGK